MRKVLVSGMIGNGLEWYDYALYGLLASTISKLFFPAGDEFVSLMATFGVFAVGFAMRPIGAVLFGYIGDKFGRRISLTISILMMALPTACIGLLPTYQQIGITATVLLTIIRLLQGLSLGGAFSGSIAFVVEHAPDRHRGSAGATCMFSMVLGILAGSAISALISYLCTPEQFESWGWRIPFIIGVLAGLVGFYIRHNVEESPKYLQAKEDGTLSNQPFKDVFKHHTGSLFQAIGIYLLVTVPFYILAMFLVTFMEKMLGHPKGDALLMNTLSMFMLLIFIPLSAWLSDKIGRRKVLGGVAALFLVCAGPAFWLICMPGFAPALAGQLLFAALVGLFLGPVPAVLVEIFPTSVRYTGMSLSYNICAALFGGTAPLVATKMIELSEHHAGIGNSVAALLGHSKAIPALYVIVCALIALVALYFFKDKYDKPLD